MNLFVVFCYFVNNSSQSQWIGGFVKGSEIKRPFPIDCYSVLLKKIKVAFGHAVAYLVEELWYKLAECGFESGCCNYIF
jgi:hypothetical protein